MSEERLQSLRAKLERAVVPEQQQKIRKLILKQEQLLAQKRGINPVDAVAQEVTVGEVDPVATIRRAQQDARAIHCWKNLLDRMANIVIANDSLFEYRCETPDKRYLARTNAAYIRASEQRLAVLRTLDAVSTSEQLQSVFDQFNKNEQELEDTLIRLCPEPLPKFAAETRPVVVCNLPLDEDAPPQILYERLRLRERWFDARRLSERSRGYQALALLIDKVQSAVVAMQRRYDNLPSLPRLSNFIAAVAVRLEWWIIVAFTAAIGYASVEFLYRMSPQWSWIVSLIDVLRGPLGLLNLENLVADVRSARVDRLALAASLLLAGSIFQKCSERTRMSREDRWAGALNGTRKVMYWAVGVSTFFAVLLQNRFPVGEDGLTAMRANEVAVRVADEGSIMQARNLVQAHLASQIGDFRTVAENIGDYWMAGGRMSAISPDYVEFEAKSNVWGKLPPNATPETPGELMVAALAARPPSDAVMAEWRDDASGAISAWVTWDEYALLAREQSLMPPDIRARFTSLNPSPLAQRYARALTAESEQELLAAELDAAVGEAAAGVVRQLPTEVQETVVATWTYASFNQVSATTYSVETAYKLLSSPYVQTVGVAALTAVTGGVGPVMTFIAGIKTTYVTAGVMGAGLIMTNYLHDDTLPSNETARRIREGSSMVPRLTEGPL